MKAVVLLGYRNSGKDSVCKALQQKFKNLHNAKFGAYNKKLASYLLGCKVEELEDKSWREEPWFLEFSPLDLLNALFVFSNTNERMQKNIDNYCLKSIPNSSIPVFTDIRRQRELNKVFEKYDGEVYIYYLEPDSANKSEGDEDIDDLVTFNHIKAFLSGTIAQNTEVIANHIKNKTWEKQKPILHLFLNTQDAFVSSLPVYEPLSMLLEKTTEFSKSISVYHQDLNVRLLQTIVQEIGVQNVELTPIEGDCKMWFFPQQHMFIVPMLREKATLKVHLPKPPITEEIKDFTHTYFSTEEIVYHAR